MANAAAVVDISSDSVPAPEAALARAAGHAALRGRARHHATLAALSGSAPAFPAAAQLASRWLAAHMLSNHVAEPLSELLTAAVFSADAAAHVPGELHLLIECHVMMAHTALKQCLAAMWHSALCGIRKHG